MKHAQLSVISHLVFVIMITRNVFDISCDQSDPCVTIEHLA